jgi:hypothetical protein
MNMKYLLIAFALTLSTNVFAQVHCCTTVVDRVETKEDVNTPTPEELKGATYTVVTRDGKTHKMKASQFKVVPRKQQLKVKKEVITQVMCCGAQAAPVVVPAPVVVTKTVTVTRVQRVVERPRNIISLTVKRSLEDYTIEQTSPGTYHVQNQYSAAVGLMYQRNVFSNEIGGSIGLGF